MKDMIIQKAYITMTLNVIIALIVRRYRGIVDDAASTPID